MKKDVYKRQQQYHLEKMAKNKVIKLLGGKNSSAYLKYSKKAVSYTHLSTVLWDMGLNTPNI